MLVHYKQFVREVREILDLPIVFLRDGGVRSLGADAVHRVHGRPVQDARRSVHPRGRRLQDRPQVCIEVGAD
jgi:hypothetical protein